MSQAKISTPYFAEVFSQLFDSPHYTVHVLAVERTFWEKVTILHALHHRSKLRDCMSRHYYDTFIMAQRGVVDAALRDIALLEKVVRNKSLMFSDNKASYDTAIIGSLRLMPRNEMLADLKKDYADMSNMFLGNAPDFDVMMQGIADLEKRINASVA